MSEWYYAEGQQRQGPVSDQDLRLLFQRGQVNLDTLVWREGMGQWAKLSTVTQELQLETLASAASASDGFDLRGDYAAIDNGTAPLPGSGPLSSSPYSAPAAAVSGYASASAVQGAEVVYAGFWKRFAAYLIDYVILTVAGAVIGGMLGLGFGAAAAFSNDTSTAGVLSQLAGALVGFAISLAYYGWFHASTGGATPGKLAIGIKVVRSNGDRLTGGRSVGRYFATILSSITLLIGYIMAAFTERKQALHDLICDTVVVDKWAFTDQPHRQRHELGAVTIVILVVGGIAMLGLFVAMIAAIGYIAKMAG